LHDRLLEEGLICRPIGDTLAFSPPLVTTEADVDEMVSRFEKGLERLSAELRAEGEVG